MIPIRTGPVNKKALGWFIAFTFLFLICLGLFFTFVIALNIFPAIVALVCMLLCYRGMLTNGQEV